MKSFPEKKSLIKLRNGNKIGYAIYGNKKNFPIFYFHGWPGSRFELKNIPLKKFRNKIIENLNKSNFAKDIFYNLADKGVKF